MLLLLSSTVCAGLERPVGELAQEEMRDIAGPATQGNQTAESLEFF